MSANISKSRERFISQAESAFGRPLRPQERKVALQFNGTVLKLALESLSGGEIAEMVSGAVRDTGSVSLLEHLASGTDSVAACRQRLLGFLKPGERRVAASFHFEGELERFSVWFIALLRSDPLPSTIRALNFGLFQSDGGCKLYVTGANAYDADDSDWACAKDWWPQGRYAPLQGLAEIFQALHKAGAEAWVVAQAFAILLIRALFEAHSSEIKALMGKKRLFLASGFDDGDLYAINTPVTRRA